MKNAWSYFSHLDKKNDRLLTPKLRLFLKVSYFYGIKMFLDRSYAAPENSSSASHAAPGSKLRLVSHNSNYTA